jgi:type IV fimbrial biogenesis protein FimT
MVRCNQNGFTLWELLMTLLVAGILLGIGVPNVMEFQRNGAMTAAANDLVTAVLTARTEAVKRQAFVTLCLSNDPLAPAPVCLPNPVADAASGFVVFVDENGNTDANGARILVDVTDGNAAIDANEPVLMRTDVRVDSIRLTADCGHVSFSPNGFTRQVAALCFPAVRSVLLCDDRGSRIAAGSLSAARVVRIDRPGRGQVLQEQGDIAAAIGVLTAAGVAPTCP